MRDCVRIWPFSWSTTLTSIRRVVSPKKRTFRHSITNLRFGAEPSSSVRTLAYASTNRSSQNA